MVAFGCRAVGLAQRTYFSCGQVHQEEVCFGVPDVETAMYALCEEQVTSARTDAWQGGTLVDGSGIIDQFGG